MTKFQHLLILRILMGCFCFLSSSLIIVYCRIWLKEDFNIVWAALSWIFIYEMIGDFVYSLFSQRLLKLSAEAKEDLLKSIGEYTKKDAGF